ncbi:MAG: ethanolamine ammonia-lyase subunit EutB [Pirellulaceae bacterium]|nr:ethanolamine ammonia-lyase subunit EutB [Pirellulaceae bacterium]
MTQRSNLQEIHVPVPATDEIYTIVLLDRDYTFHGLKQLLGAADVSKAGDRSTGLCAENEIARQAARSILSSLTLQHLYDRPLVDDEGRTDSIMRVNYDLNLKTFQDIASKSLGQLKDHLLNSSPEEIKRVGRGLTGVMVAAIVKLLDVHEMIYLSKQIRQPTKARTQIGLSGTLSSRLQPNHPTDDLNGITLLTYVGLSMGSGDCLLGLNPSVDTVDNIDALLRHLDKLRRDTEAPTQICVLSHLKTQLACLERGAPVEIIFQSLAGTDRTLVEEFDVTVELLDQAREAMAQQGPLRDRAEQFMYFETGQGSEFSYGKHNGIDMTTCEALCYGLARRYDPFMVNNVTGFIGPETHLDNFEMMISNLQDHCMGKLLGLPMGMAPCYTLHSRITNEGQQMATQLLTAAGSNYFMDVYLGTDRMLAYFDTSGHDDQTLREVHDLQPTDEFLQWGLRKGVFKQDHQGKVTRGTNWGNPRIFCDSDAEFQRLRESVSATYGFDNAGPRPANQVSLEARANQAVAREATYAELRTDILNGCAYRVFATAAPNKVAHLNDPSLGARLEDTLRSKLTPEDKDVQIVVSDGLSAEAIHANLPDLLEVVLDGLRAHQLSLGEPIIAPYGRVKLAESIGNALEPQLVINLIGERPGGDALASRSMSAYLAYRLADAKIQKEAAEYSGNSEIQYEFTLISNIYSAGLPPIEAGSLIVEKAIEILQHQAAGNRLENRLQR